VGYLISAAEGQTSVNLTDPQWRALIYVASQHGFSTPHLRLEGEGETLEVDGSDAEGLRSALGKALEARAIEQIRTPDGELDYDTIQRVRHVLLSDGVRLARPRRRRASKPLRPVLWACSPECVEGVFSEVRLAGVLRSSLTA